MSLLLLIKSRVRDRASYKIETGLVCEPRNRQSYTSNHSRLGRMQKASPREE